MPPATEMAPLPTIHFTESDDQIGRTKLSYSLFSACSTALNADLINGKQFTWAEEG